MEPLLCGIVFVKQWFFSKGKFCKWILPEMLLVFRPGKRYSYSYADINYTGEFMKTGYRCVNGFVLKMIAIVTMLVDHMGAILYPEQMMFRYIGRIAFPIFVFLIVEGFCHTRNIRKYELRLLLFALVSEIPFDLAFRGRVLEFTYQNVFFTLFLGLVMLDVIRVVRKRIPPAWTVVAEVAVLVLFMLLAELLRTDYGAGGVLLVYAFYRLKGKALWLTIVLLIVSYVCFGLTECLSVIAMIPVVLYNGKRGFERNGIYSGQNRSPAGTAVKYAFYLFYPVHLMILYGISILRLAG